MKTTRILFHASWISTCYFLLLALNYYVIKNTAVWLGAVQELITLPIILMQLVLFAAALVYWVKDNYRIKTYAFWTMIISLCNCLAIAYSFIDSVS